MRESKPFFGGLNDLLAGRLNMSTKYKHGDNVPTDTIISRLNELSDAVTKGKGAIDREFTMRVPAELDRDADLVLSQAAKRIAYYRNKADSFEEKLDEIQGIVG